MGGDFLEKKKNGLIFRKGGHQGRSRLNMGLLCDLGFCNRISYHLCPLLFGIGQELAKCNCDWLTFNM